MMIENLLIELLTEELPPKSLDKLGNAFAAVIADSLKSQNLTTPDTILTAFASPPAGGASDRHSCSGTGSGRSAQTDADYRRAGCTRAANAGIT